MNTASLPTELVKRAAALAVSRYGVDQKRVGRAIQTVLQAQADGVSGDFLDILVAQGLLTPPQADQLREELQASLHQVAVTQVAEAETPPTGPSEPATTPSDAPRAPVPPTRSGYFLCSLGGYRLLRRLGEGGMGTVYLAYSEAQGKQVAIKVLADRLASNTSYVDRFLREARNGGRLDHPNIVHCIEAGKDEASGKHYLVMEYVDGPSARTLLDREGRLPVGDAVHLIIQIARALRYVHARDFIHRDIKPDNILIDADGVAKLADLGLAKCIADASQLTGAKQGFGTPYYMPCEQAVDATRVDARCDIYALGATLYHLVTGVVPFPGETHLQVAERKVAGTFTPAGSIYPEAVPLDPILAKMLAQDPDHRYQSARELIADLERSGLDKPSSSNPTDVDTQDPDTTDESSGTGHVTQLDLTAPGGNEVWYVRYRERDGQWCSLRASAAEIVKQLRSGALPPACEVARTPQSKYEVASSYPEFRVSRGRLTPTPPPAPTPAAKTNGHASARAAAPAPRSFATMLVGALIAVLVAAVCAWLYYLGARP